MSAPLLPNKEDIEVGLNLLTYEFCYVRKKIVGVPVEVAPFSPTG